MTKKKPVHMTKDEMQIEVLFGLQFATEAMMKALIRTCPDKDALLYCFDMEIEKEQAQTLASDRSDLCVAALTDYSTALRDYIKKWMP
ncbi:MULTISPECIES: hypothetical protein [Burkholderia]|uniref:hypothetical protein n=1 Tax=Burkholderia TaxID=32008 RepID=UPI001CF1A00F|nr:MULTISPECIES: hypothetical protein [Burkholderia]MCA8242859.1 hypothetical protein [Burkholderia sp. AU32262]MDR8105572.1 hypothetical protein [Burkholderia cenocepacia]